MSETKKPQAIGTPPHTQNKATPNRGEGGGGNTGNQYPNQPRMAYYNRPWRGGYRGRGRGSYAPNYGPCCYLKHRKYL